jgi:hypothetical protein
MLAHNLESSEWSVRGNEVIVKVSMSQVMCDVAMGDTPRRIVTEALSKASGRPMKIKMVSGGAQFVPPKVAGPATPRPGNGAGARSRAISDPVVQRMQEKFGAEIRSVIDLKERDDRACGVKDPVLGRLRFGASTGSLCDGAGFSRRQHRSSDYERIQHAGNAGAGPAEKLRKNAANCVMPPPAAKASPK